MLMARRSDADSTPVRQGAATPPSAFSQARVSGPLLFGPSGPAKCRGQGAAMQTVRQYGKELQRRHRHFLRPASPARCCSGQAGLQNVEGKAQRCRQYASTARSCNAAIGIFSGPRLRPAVVRPSGPAKCRGQGAAMQTVRQYGKEAATPPSAFSQARVSGPLLFGQAGLKNVDGKAQRRRQYASTARSCNAAIGIFSGPRLRPAIVMTFSLNGLAPKAKTAPLRRPAL